MAISFKCSCGKSLKAKEEYVGRRLRCPTCQKVLTIPAASNPGTDGVSSFAPAVRGGTPATLSTRTVTISAADLDITRPQPIETRPASTFASVPDPALSTTPVVPAPVVTPPVASPVVPAAVPLAEPPATVRIRPTNPWADFTFIQMETAWRDGDHDRFQAGVRPAREREVPLLWALPLSLAAAFLLTVG